MIERIAAFSANGRGGNPAGVVVGETLPPEAEMKALARRLGYSETVFSAPEGNRWRTRYFSPDAEIPFCGHATIALGAVLARTRGRGPFELKINAGTVSTEGFPVNADWGASLRSPPTQHCSVEPNALEEAMLAFGLHVHQLDPSIPPARIHAGADHLLLALRNRQTLRAMAYDFPTLQKLMRRENWVTVALCHVESESTLHVRNAFAYGGVYEDPATGAAAAALGGYLRDINQAHGQIVVWQGEDMGIPCRIEVEAEPGVGNPVKISGETRPCGDDVT
jgi:PhzF family phenazine biosynthesis protein